MVLKTNLVITSYSIHYTKLYDTITVTSFELAAFSVTVALLIAGVKGFMILTYFMHLKYESLLLRILVALIFVLYALVVLITFIDYAYR